MFFCIKLSIIFISRLRNQICEYLFSTTTLRFRKPFKPKKPDESPLRTLAILQVCRRIYEDVKLMWLGLVSFDFPDMYVMVDRLTPLSTLDLSRLRHVHVDADSLGLSFDGEGNDRQRWDRFIRTLKEAQGYSLD